MILAYYLLFFDIHHRARARMSDRSCIYSGCGFEDGIPDLIQEKRNTSSARARDRAIHVLQQTTLGSLIIFSNAF